jgi:hypothetical protein
MAARNGRSADQVRRDIEFERELLADAVEDLRGGLAQVTDIGAKLRSKLPLVAAGALGAGFFLGGGIGATMRMLARRGREGTTKAKLGPFSLVDRDD